jgi:hypothetical protein
MPQVISSRLTGINNDLVLDSCCLKKLIFETGSNRR